MLNITELKFLADGLKQYYKESNKSVTHTECLDIVARAQGYANWQTLNGAFSSQWAYIRHVPYLPNHAETVKSLSVRAAMFQELLAMDDDGQAMPEVRRSLSRFFYQLDAVRSGQLRVNVELAAAVQERGYNRGALEDELQASAKAFREFLVDHGFKPQTAKLAQRYNLHYVQWRLAEFRLAFAEYPNRSLLMDLIRDDQDVFKFMALCFTGQLDYQRMRSEPIESISSLCTNASVSKHDRSYAKFLTLECLSGSTSDFLKLNEDLVAFGGPRNEAFEMFHQVFPEVRMWQTWVELKGHLAEGADGYHQRRVHSSAV